jgi:integrase
MYTYERQWENYIEPRWGATRLSSIHYEDVAEWVSTLQSISSVAEGHGKSAGAETKKAVGGLFSRMLRFAVMRRYLARNPAEDASGRASYIPGKREVSQTKRQHIFLTASQLMAVADHSEEYRDLILFAGTCGLRWGEIAALQVRDVKLDSKPFVHVQRAFKEVGGQLSGGTTKSGENRKVPVPGMIAPMLRQRIQGREPNALVFTSPNGGALRNSNFTKRYYAPAIKAAAIASGDPDCFPRPTFHDLRHTAVSLAISQGANVKVVQRIAGHADAKMTLNTYAGLYDDDLHDSAERIDAALLEAAR